MNVPELFISYRREDTRQISERIHERLIRAFGNECVFIDVEDIPPGSDFPSHITSTIASCKVLLVMIGESWLEAQTPTGERRLEQHVDFVRAEIEAGFEHALEVVPVLIDGARMPDENDLPSSIGQLARMNAVEVRSGADFDFTTQRLIEFLASKHELKRIDRRFRWEVLLLILSIMAAYIGTVCSVMEPMLLQNGNAHWTYAEASSSYWIWQLTGPFLLGAGPLGIAISRWVCCQLNAGRRDFGNGIFARKRKAPRAMFAFALGLACFGWGPLAIVPTAVLAYLGWQQIRQQPAIFTGKKYVLLAVVLGLLGLVVCIGFQFYTFYLVRAYRHMDQTATAIKAGDPDRAGQHLDAALLWLPEHRRTYLLEGELLMLLGEYRAAIDVLTIPASYYTSGVSLLPEQNAQALQTFELLVQSFEALGDDEGRAEAQKFADEFRGKAANLGRDRSDGRLLRSTRGSREADDASSDANNSRVP